MFRNHIFEYDPNNTLISLHAQIIYKCDPVNISSWKADGVTRPPFPKGLLAIVSDKWRGSLSLVIEPLKSCPYSNKEPPTHTHASNFT